MSDTTTPAAITVRAWELEPGDVLAEPFGPDAGAPIGTVVEVDVDGDRAAVTFDPTYGKRRTDNVRAGYHVPLVSRAADA